MPALSAQQATEVHIALTKRLLSWLAATKLCPIDLWCSPDSGHHFFKHCADEYGVSLHNQCAGDLGVKMDHAIQLSLNGSKQVLLLGCDSPSLSEPDLVQALTDLNSGKEVVLAPAEDGGYVMIGCHSPQPKLFTEMAWGTETVFQITVERLDSLGSVFSTTPLQWDVDRFEDWQRFCEMK
ncbi:MAG: rSAM/selenodomain-associated transferase 1 [Methylophagaceae bacterium]|jgi:rSAM/selenodomain-associated transferase 1